MKDHKTFIGVIGGGDCSREIARLAEDVGQRIAQAGGILVCGGMRGVMEAACKGAKEKGGATIGILPGVDKDQANPYVDFPIVTGLGEGRNLLVVRNSDAVIALPGKFGTLSEIAFCLRLGKPVIGLSTWMVSDEIIPAEDPEKAVEIAFEKAKSTRNRS